MAEKLLSEKQLSAFCSGLAMMLRSGVPQSDAVALLAREDAAPYAHGDAALASGLHRAAGLIGEYMEAGDDFSAAAEKTGMFPEYALGVFRTAEFSGRLDDALDRLARYYEGQNRLVERLRGAVVYPVALMLLMCVVLAVLVFAVLPVFLRVYSSMTGSLSASAFAYVPAANAIGRISLILSLIVGAAMLVLAFLVRSPNGRERLRPALEKNRLTCRALRMLSASQITGTVSTLLLSGADEITALDYALRRSMGGALDTVMKECRSDMESGMSLCRALQRRQVLPVMYAQMLLGSEESGMLPQTMEYVSRQLAEDAENALCAVIDGIEPVLIGYLTVTVGFTLLSVMLPLLGILNGL